MLFFLSLLAADALLVAANGVFTSLDFPTARSLLQVLLLKCLFLPISGRPYNFFSSFFAFLFGNNIQKQKTMRKSNQCSLMLPVFSGNNDIELSRGK